MLLLKEKTPRNALVELRTLIRFAAGFDSRAAHQLVLVFTSVCRSKSMTVRA